MKLFEKEPANVDELRNMLWEYMAREPMERVDNVIEFLYRNKDLLDEWAKEYLV